MQMTRWNRATWTPFDTLFDMHRELDRVLEDASRGGNGSGMTVLAADLIETPDEIRAMMEVPGLRPEDVDITIDNGVLTIAGEKKVTLENEEESTYRVSERRFGRFQRSFTLPRNIEADQVSADYDHGVLTVRLPKKEEARPRRIEVRTSSGTQQVGSGE